MADFKLTDRGDIVLNGFSEETCDTVWEACYPELRAALDDAGAHKRGARARILEAVKHERTRLWDNQPKDEARTELGKILARQLRTTRPSGPAGSIWGDFGVYGGSAFGWS